MRNKNLGKIETAIIEYLKANGGSATLSQSDIAKIADVNRMYVTRNIDKLDFQDKVKAKPEGNKFYFELAGKKPLREYNNGIGLNFIDDEEVDGSTIKYLDKTGKIIYDFEPRPDNYKDFVYYREKMCAEHFKKLCIKVYPNFK